MLLIFLRGFDGGQYREILILNVTWFLRGSDGGQNREILILNVTVLVVRVWWRAI